MCTNPIRLYRNDDCGWFKKRPPTPLERLDNPDFDFSTGAIDFHYEVRDGQVYFFDDYKCFSDYPFYDLVPCGKCVECLIFRRSEWALRIVHESKNHPCSCFLTLTYSDENLPYSTYDDRITLYKPDLQKFFKRLRKRLGNIKVRYYACGEYGETTQRPHYHVILFGYDFSKDRQLFFNNDKGHKYYTSKFLEDVWQLGHCLIAEVNYSTAGYVAGYVNKKLDQDYSEKRFYNQFCAQLSKDLGKDLKQMQIDLDIATPEFSVCSNRPGIGFSHLEKYGEQYLQHGFCVNPNKRKQPLPRYYQKKLKERELKLFREYLVKKMERMDSSMRDPEVLYSRHKYRDLNHKRNRRSKV